MECKADDDDVVRYPGLYQTCFRCPGRGEAFLSNHSTSSLAAISSVEKLSKLYNCSNENGWKSVSEKIKSLDLISRCKKCFEKSGIYTILFDDLLSGVEDSCHRFNWHARFTVKPPKRIVRLETLFQDRLQTVISIEAEKKGNPRWIEVLMRVADFLENQVFELMSDPDVVAFKSIIAYRSGLDVTVTNSPIGAMEDLKKLMDRYNEKKDLDSIRLDLETKDLNDYLLGCALETLKEFKNCVKRPLPVQFHVGLGDSSVKLSKGSPSNLQPLIESFPEIPIVLLHASYPFTREASFLCSVYENVYLDFGEVSILLSTSGLEKIIQQCLEVCPTTKLLWSTDGPETFYLATLQSRRALYRVFMKLIQRDDLTEKQSIEIVQRLLFLNSNDLYSLGFDKSVVELSNYDQSVGIIGTFNDNISTRGRNLNNSNNYQNSKNSDGSQNLGNFGTKKDNKNNNTFKNHRRKFKNYTGNKGNGDQTNKSFNVSQSSSTRSGNSNGNSRNRWASKSKANNKSEDEVIFI
ncbi:amidohydrolase-domain-containing protein [Phakopsora pachyrhizi]|uniref:Amidohydrolase-domain-containing protein n=1 Tax=Phakopsora pachyrhizi TaxID=170000 RepID=A0AAV0AIC9_PHAPC|nr:amidohydrolase-domain-containing protein [Phakopsora pachyrhizi]